MLRHVLTRRAISGIFNARLPAPLIGLDRFLGDGNLQTKEKTGRWARLEKRTLTAAANRDSFIHNDTIYALSTATGKAGIAVIRISGPGCADVSVFLCIAILAVEANLIDRFIVACVQANPCQSRGTHP
jgi:hypothetical protein